MGGRSRSGCYFCFYQQKIEWVRLYETHPHLFELAMEYEEKSVEFGEQFYWCQNETLRQLREPARIEKIKADWEKAQARKKAKRGNRSLIETLGGGWKWKTTRILEMDVSSARFEYVTGGLGGAFNDGNR
ncbi:hypothetical protein Q644_12030 [Brucella intermedia 229E]|uniref:Phosphoadenosine phosphosulphate reductase domain-containing protein n=1 Tax=Brucella intermedia 229E TaxID=1337887 RepID=U4VK82_9HYPH|nr:hypothetical protein Q644_12030 [Brucella intermedia 229E]